jgi:hypothetical protein
MQSPTRQAKVQAEQGATLPMAVKLAMVLSLVLGAAVTLRWSSDPPKFVLVRPFQVRAQTTRASAGARRRVPHTKLLQLESAQLTSSNAHVTSRTCRGGCSMALRQPLDSQHPCRRWRRCGRGRCRRPASALPAAASRWKPPAPPRRGMGRLRLRPRRSHGQLGGRCASTR